MASGVPVDGAAAAVLALAAGTRDADLVEFRRAVERDIALGASPGAAASAAAAALSSAGAQSAGRGQQGHPSRPYRRELRCRSAAGFGPHRSPPRAPFSSLAPPPKPPA